jgi:hypothetical protein
MPLRSLLGFFVFYLAFSISFFPFRLIFGVALPIFSPNSLLPLRSSAAIVLENKIPAIAGAVLFNLNKNKKMYYN